ncbi:hypothetical protein PROFUN_10302 [Planoprotostelium fungivorum]|uniref:Glyoxalase-like domain-containing protein n=1 Tax=Planoprotostelium fungivorum TaxID=1890364 RepID=A0A2P6MRS4_9EUKA|nr:hypothetical protein PROFUN_10302 [Planoprotostelium fungivorum]
MPQLDHLVLLVPREVLDQPPESLTTVFSLYPGGQHADGKTFNTLILLEDGVYIELIAFSTENLKEGHWWGSMPNGWIDWALLGEPSDDVRKSLTGTILHPIVDSPLQGKMFHTVSHHKVEGREETAKRYDGRGVDNRRGNVPFWCHDLTDRTLRVPPPPSPHPSKVTSIRQLTFIVHRERLPRYRDFYSSLVTLTRDAENLMELNLDTPRGGSCKVVVKTPENEMEEEFVGGEDGGPLLYRVSLSEEQRKI